MKRSLAALLAVFASVSAQAGSFGGPPFSNGSPLVTGVDGSYQASARALNVTGIFRFQYSGGAQTSTSTRNNWIFFVNGQIQRGSVVANINSSKVDGILDSVSGLSSTNSSGSISLPIVLLNANNSSSGSFKGKMSGNGDFSGSGQLTPSAALTNQLIGIATNAFGFNVTTATYTNSAGSISNTPFKFKGVRTSTTVTSTN